MSTQSSPKSRLWVLSWGLFPPRVLIYLAEKGIASKFDIIDVDIGMNGMEEAEGKPPGTLPILEISRPEGDKPGRYIYQSAAILEYLEDAYGSEGPDMRGETPEARARVRECMDAVTEATTWLVLYVQNGSTLYQQLRTQSVEAAKEGLERIHKSFSLLEKLADPEGGFLVGGKPTIVDCVLMSTIWYFKTAFEGDLAEGHPRLQEVAELFAKRGTADFPEVPEALRKMGLSMHVK